MTVIINIILLVLMMGFLVLVHELGHFLWAKKFGVYIYEFSIGMGPVIKTIKGKDGINYSIRALPIGGFVQMAGEVYEDDNKIPKEKFLCNKPWWQRLIIISAGVIHNFITAIILFFVIACFIGNQKATLKIENVTKDGAFEKAGIVAGDKILAVNDHNVSNSDMLSIFLAYKDKDGIYEFRIEHQDGKTETIEVEPIEEERDGEKVKVFGLELEVKEEKGLLASIKYAFTKFGTVMAQMWYTIGGLITGNISLNAMSGPVGIYSIVGTTAKNGALSFINLVAFLSVNLGFINFLPFPAFDGGRAVFILIEKIIGKPVDSKIENAFHTVGFFLLMLLMIYITIHDIIRLF
ncbi:MAG: RIP metalloprotease RseP [Bacilli bacterium]